ncbi:MAG TPA: winged helix-turn-helix domain-containing protein [Candidatus Dormibacteraeota bacterium]|nr:winged helix-turn-helix domain-containing protein [Candidatus Dormibacteraeota bacterium]
MDEEIGTVAGAIWHVLDAKGEMTLAKLKKEVNAGAPFFDWAIGWLAREGKIVLTREKRSFLVCLQGRHAKSASAA